MGAYVFPHFDFPPFSLPLDAIDATHHAIRMRIIVPTIKFRRDGKNKEKLVLGERLKKILERNKCVYYHLIIRSITIS